MPDFDDFDFADGADGLRAVAWLYAAGLTDEPQSREFERLLAESQEAREALAEAAAPLAPRGPSPDYRDRVRARLRPEPVTPRPRLRRPLAGGLALAAAVLLAVGLWPTTGNGPELAPPAETGAAPAVTEAPCRPADPEADFAEQIRAWSDLPRPRGVQKAHAEQQEEKCREQRLLRLLELEDGRAGLTISYEGVN